MPAFFFSVTSVSLWWTVRLSFLQSSMLPVAISAICPPSGAWRQNFRNAARKMGHRRYFASSTQPISPQRFGTIHGANGAKSRVIQPPRAGLVGGLSELCPMPPRSCKTPVIDTTAAALRAALDPWAQSRLWPGFAPNDVTDFATTI